MFGFLTRVASTESHATHCLRKKLNCDGIRVAEQRRALPAGGAVTKLYAFEGESGPVTFSDPDRKAYRFQEGARLA